ncbi:MAG: hypothetical protein BROFUL_03353 [Candidatus Brocadia fulgida]|uniref:Uncharacterized protein n=1 Tax=Candidatus Brocadia fulgida TaxID=380242 RepID=A0A0M2UQM4_9BACT|nr:MAG: hypothetical protein BROFUL_03353 [Candidatus Brocadia fulgida]
MHTPSRQMLRPYLFKKLKCYKVLCFELWVEVRCWKLEVGVESYELCVRECVIAPLY